MRHASKRAIRASIHAPAREATMATITPARPAIWFQSTPPHGRRHHGKHHVTRLCESFNPRLRTGGAPFLLSAFLLLSSFNPRLRTGGDASRASSCMRSQLFQSTPPHGRRRCFQWRSRLRLRVSIHASAREATISRLHTFPHRAGFNPRLRTGGDLTAAVVAHVLVVSIHASAREATLCPLSRWPCPSAFQSTPPHGRRPACLRAI